MKSVVVLSPESLSETLWLKNLQTCLDRLCENVEFINCVPLKKGKGTFDWVNTTITQLSPFDLILLIGPVAYSTTKLSLLGKARILVVPGFTEPKWTNKTFKTLEQFIKVGQSDLEFYFKSTSSRLTVCDLIPF